jgi:DNA invertase Pin-like site-specific DNA recombinase
MTQPKRWATYLGDRTGNGLNLERQLAAIRAVLPRDARRIVLTDTDGSARATGRPAYRALLHLIGTGTITGVAVSDVARPSRDGGALRALAQDLRARGIELRIATLHRPNQDPDAWTLTLQVLVVGLETLALDRCGRHRLRRGERNARWAG